MKWKEPASQGDVGLRNQKGTPGGGARNTTQTLRLCERSWADCPSPPLHGPLKAPSTVGAPLQHQHRNTQPKLFERRTPKHQKAGLSPDFSLPPWHCICQRLPEVVALQVMAHGWRNVSCAAYQHLLVWHDRLQQWYSPHLIAVWRCTACHCEPILRSHPRTSWAGFGLVSDSRHKTEPAAVFRAGIGPARSGLTFAAPRWCILRGNSASVPLSFVTSTIVPGVAARPRK